MKEESLNSLNHAPNSLFFFLFLDNRKHSLVVLPFVGFIFVGTYVFFQFSQ